MTLLRVSWLWVLCLGALAACSPPQIVVSVGSQLAVPDAIDQIVLTVDGPNSHATRTAALTGQGALALPLTLGLRGVDGETVHVTVSASFAGHPVATRSVRTHFVAGRVLALPIELLCGCDPQQCGVGTRCETAACGDDTVDPATLPDWSGAPDATTLGVCAAMDAATDATDAAALDGDAVDARDVADAADAVDATDAADAHTVDARDVVVADARDAGGVPDVLLGYPTVGAHAWVLSADHSRAIAVTPAAPVSVLRVGMYVDGFAGPDAGAQAVRAVIYAGDGAGGAPGTVHCQSDISGINAGRPAGWFELGILAPCLLDAGATYYLGVHAGGPVGAGRLYYDDATSPVLWYSEVDAFGDGPATFVVQLRDTRWISVYAVTVPH